MINLSQGNTIRTARGPDPVAASFREVGPADPPGEWYPADLRRDWEGRVAASGNVNAAYQSPSWFDHVHRMLSPDERLGVVEVRDEAGRRVGVAPLRVTRDTLDFPIAGRTLAVPMRKVWVMGARPPLPEDPAVHDRFFEAILASFPSDHCTALAGVPEAGFLFDYLNHSDFIKKHYLLGSLDGLRSFHTLPLPPTFEEYLDRFDAKKRYNLKRQVRRLGEHQGAGTTLRTIESREDVLAHLASESGLFAQQRRSWQGFVSPPCFERSVDRLADLAGCGLLLGYVLSHGPRMIAAVIGMRHEGIFSVTRVTIDGGYREFSPGSVLLHLAIEDLIKNQNIHLINYGFGEPAYRMSNEVHPYASILLLPKTPRNRLLRASYTTFFKAKHLVQGGLSKHRGSTDADVAAAPRR